LSFLAINPTLSSGTGSGDVLQCMNLQTVPALRRAPRWDRNAPAGGVLLPRSWRESKIDTHLPLNITRPALVPGSAATPAMSGAGAMLLQDGWRP
jgi:hypothetical protein